MATEPVPTEHLALIGSVVNQFNLLDGLLTTVLVGLTGNNFMDMKAHIPFAKLHFGLKKTILDAIIGAKEDVPKDSLLATYAKTTSKLLDDIQVERNAIAHSVWTCADGEVKRRRLRANKKVTVEAFKIEKQELSDLVARIESCRAEMAALAIYVRESNSRPHAGQNVNTLSKALGVLEE